MIKYGQIYRCRYQKNWREEGDVDFYVLVTRVPTDQIALTIISDKNENGIWVGALANDPIEVVDPFNISKNEEKDLFYMLEYELCPTYQVNFKSPQ